MGAIEELGRYLPQMTEWRRHIHQNPETAFEEVGTARFVAERLRAFGVDAVHEGIAKTGVVGVIKAGTSDRAIGLRADLDAHDMQEGTGVAWASKTPGKHHACGHDGHTTMLLGAARHLAATRDFDGTVYVIFQPAEENEGGGRVMHLRRNGRVLRDRHGDNAGDDDGAHLERRKRGKRKVRLRS